MFVWKDKNKWKRGRGWLIFKKKLVDYGGIAMLNLNPELGTYNGWKLPIFWAKNLQWII